MFVYRTIDRFTKTSTIDDRKRSGRPRVVRTDSAIKTVRERISRDPCTKQTDMSKEMDISARSMARLIRDDLHIKAYRRSTGSKNTNELSKKSIIQ